MANTQSANVIKVDTSAAFTGAKFIRSIKYIGAASGTASIQASGVSSGITVWQESGTANLYNPDVCLVDGEGFYVTVTNSAVVYLYLK